MTPRPDYLFRIGVAAVIVLGIALTPAPAAAAPLRTFEVDPAGNDSAAGSSTSPWRTLQKAANTVRAGDLVIVRAGRSAGLYLTTSGTATDPITFRGDPGAIVDTQNPTTPDLGGLHGARAPSAHMDGRDDHLCCDRRPSRSHHRAPRRRSRPRVAPLESRHFVAAAPISRTRSPSSSTLGPRAIRGMGERSRPPHLQTNTRADNVSSRHKGVNA